MTNSTLTFLTPQAHVANTAEVSVSLNGQQFSKSSTVHNPSKQAVFDFYEEPYVSYYTPARGPTNGGTPVEVQGFNFRLNRPHLKDTLYARFIDTNSKQELAPASEVREEDLFADKFLWVTPAVNQSGDAVFQISLNKVDWSDVRDVSSGNSFNIYQSPHVTSINPSFGHVKAAKD